VLRILLAENVSLKNIVPIATTLLDTVDTTKDPVLLAAEVRCTLRRQIVESLAGARPELKVFNLTGELENMLLAALAQARQGGAKVALDNFAIEPICCRSCRCTCPGARPDEAAGPAPADAGDAADPPLLARYARLFAPGLGVLSYNEIPENREISVIGTVG
jgi:flagellar biosynthesis protein FlhA